MRGGRLPAHGNCRSRGIGCGAPVLWVRSENGKLMPLEAQPSPDGRYQIDGEVAYYLKGMFRDLAVEQGEPLYKSHFANCPKANSHRRDRASA